MGSYVGDVWGHMLEMCGVKCWRCVGSGVGDVWGHMLEMCGVRCWRCVGSGVGDVWGRVFYKTFYIVTFSINTFRFSSSMRKTLNKQYPQLYKACIVVIVGN